MRPIIDKYSQVYEIFADKPLVIRRYESIGQNIHEKTESHDSTGAKKMMWNCSLDNLWHSLSRLLSCLGNSLCGLLLFTSFYLITPQALAQNDGIANSRYVRHSFDGLIINENAILGVCGEMKFVRRRRNCLDANVSSLKQCLKLDSIDPLFKENPTASYNCVNSSSSGGAEVIRALLEESETRDSCLAQNVRFFYEELIESSDFQTLSQEFESGLGFPLVLNFAIDTRDSISSLQLDLSDSRIPGVEKESINLNMTSFSQEAPCQRISREAIFNRVTEEFTRLTMISSRQKYDPYDQDPEQSLGNNRVFNSNRFLNAEGPDSYSISRDDIGSADLEVEIR